VACLDRWPVVRLPRGWHDMVMKRPLIIFLAALAAVAPALATQNFSEGFLFLKAVRDRDGTTAERILSNPASTAINHRDASSGEGALHILVRGQDLTWLSFMLARSARPDLQSNDGTTPLLIASAIGWGEGASQLLSRGANVNLANRRGETPLILAVQRRDLAMVRLLLSAGANPLQADTVASMSAMDYARQDPRAGPIVRELQARQPR
jgi:uncharacterized protein